MKIQSVRIENFRSFRDETIPLDDYSCFVGPNGAGKSTVLAALNLFFQTATSGMPNPKSLEEEDFHNKAVTRPVRVTVTFDNLPNEAKEILKDYVRQDKLIVTSEALWDADQGTAPVRQFGQRLGMKVFAEGYFKSESEKAKVADLKVLYVELKRSYPDLPTANTAAAMKEALQAYEASHPDQCELIASNDDFYGANNGKLNAFIQWVYVPAVKEVQEEGEETKRGALGQLLARTVRATTDFGNKIDDLRRETFAKFEALLAENQGALSTISNKLKLRLAEWSHADTNLNLRWLSDKLKSVQVLEPTAGVFTGEGDFSGRLSRMGHGLQRSYLLALLTELADLGTEDAPTLILACEEPELYQHPPQARRLSEVFRKLSEANTQVLVTTHSPYFVTGDGFANVRLIRRSEECASVLSHASSVDFRGFLDIHSHHRERPTVAGMRVKINQSLQPHLNEMFFCKHPVFVEGLEDVAFITAALHLYGRWEEFHSLGCHLIPANGKNHLIHPVAIATKMTIPFYLVFDCDSDCREEDRPKHEPDNKTLFSMIGAPTADGFPPTGVSVARCRAWPTNLGSAIDADFGAIELDGYKQRAMQVCGGAKSLGKNSMFISEWLNLAFEGGSKSATLEALCDAIIASARA